MKRGPGTDTKRPEKLFNQLQVEFPHFFFRQSHPKDQIRAIAKIDAHARLGLVHGNRGRTVTRNAFLFTQSIGKGFSQLGDTFLDAIRRTVSRSAFPEGAQQVRIIPTTLTEEAVAFGAASLVIEAAFANI